MKMSPGKRLHLFTDLDRSKITIRKDTLHRRVSSSSDMSLLDMEDNVFSPSPKIEKRKISRYVIIS